MTIAKLLYISLSFIYLASSFSHIFILFAKNTYSVHYHQVPLGARHGVNQRTATKTTTKTAIKTITTTNNNDNDNGDDDNERTIIEINQAVIITSIIVIIRNQRMIMTMTKIGPAVLNGGVSTLLAFSLLYTSQSYVFLSFFKIFFLICILGLFHGLLVLPVLLSLIGPLPNSKQVP